MPVTILAPHPERYTKLVLPQRAGIEERDLRAFPLPPNVSLVVLDVVCRELREHGHTVSYTSKRERLADWSTTRRMNQHSEDLYGSGDTLLHFIGGGWDVTVRCDERETRLMPQHLRMGRAGLRLVIAGHP